jgi:hypothetical protein
VAGTANQLSEGHVDLEQLTHVEVAIQRRLERHLHLKNQLEAAYGHWLAKNRRIVVDFESRLDQKQAVLAQLDKTIYSTRLAEGTKGRWPINNSRGGWEDFEGRHREKAGRETFQSEAR